MAVEQIIADFQAKGQLRPETADWLLKIYRHEIAQHGDKGQARCVLLKRIEEMERRDNAAEALMPDAVMKKLNRPPVPLALRVLQAIFGSILGAVLAAVVVFVFVYGVMLLLKFIFSSAPGHIRVPLKGVLAVFIAPIAGAIIGGLGGWKFDARVAAEQVRIFLDALSAFDRAWIAWSVVWTGLVIMAFSMFNPFGRYGYWRHDDWLALTAIWIFPIIGGGMLAQLVRWVAAGRRE